MEISRKKQFPENETKREQGNYFSRLSITNYIRSMAYLINHRHGETIDEKIDSCRVSLKELKEKKKLLRNRDQIYSHLMFSISIFLDISLSRDIVIKNSFLLPMTIVKWYYCHYNAIRGIILAYYQDISYTHESTISSFHSNIVQHMPFPYNIRAKYDGKKSGKDIYTFEGTDIKDEVPLSFPFWPTNEEKCIGMILKYLSGTGKWKLEQIEEKIKKNASKKYKDPNFRIKKLADERKEHAMKVPLNFLQCAYRLRGKANYRDIEFLICNSKQANDSYLYDAICKTCEFIILSAFAIVEKAFGYKELEEIIKNIDSKFKDHKELPDELKIWRYMLKK